MRNKISLTKNADLIRDRIKSEAQDYQENPIESTQPNFIKMHRLCKKMIKEEQKSLSASRIRTQQSTHKTEQQLYFPEKNPQGNNRLIGSSKQGKQDSFEQQTGIAKKLSQLTYVEDKYLIQPKHFLTVKRDSDGVKQQPSDVSDLELNRQAFIPSEKPMGHTKYSDAVLDRQKYYNRIRVKTKKTLEQQRRDVYGDEQYYFKEGDQYYKEFKQKGEEILNQRILLKKNQEVRYQKELETFSQEKYQDSWLKTKKFEKRCISEEERVNLIKLKMKEKKEAYKRKQIGMEKTQNFSQYKSRKNFFGEEKTYSPLMKFISAISQHQKVSMKQVQNNLQQTIQKIEIGKD